MEVLQTSTAQICAGCLNEVPEGRALRSTTPAAHH